MRVSSLTLVTDAFVISKFVDRIVFVSRQNCSPKAFIKSINEFLRFGKHIFVNRDWATVNSMHTIVGMGTDMEERE
jgi:hypothetical protein